MENIRMLLAQAVCGLITKITGKMMTKPEGISDSEVTNYMAGMNLHELGIMHAAYYTFNCFKEAIEREKNQKIKEILAHLCTLYGIEQIMRFTHSLIQGQFISPQGISELNEIRYKIFKTLRPELIGLVDAFAIPEKFLTSALCKGNPYEVKYI